MAKCIRRECFLQAAEMSNYCKEHDPGSGGTILRAKDALVKGVEIDRGEAKEEDKA